MPKLTTQRGRHLSLKQSLSVLFLLLSIYIFVQSTHFNSTVAHFLYTLAPPKVNGVPLSFSPHHLIPYHNWVLNCGLLISCVFFCLAAEPYVTRRFKNRRVISIPVTLLAAPVYIILIFFISSGVKILFS